ncbi:hypothetical protein DPEC_G00080320 [Dallia pectoralis]|uniref:Uncharacterized protein n=1 Tax=Dallia pectoralis TaxID=75939 RepID=A0ACC2H578_DALPE|nr:hypothetical protein DPEC_G00080320 [Dallia pectoralis]
MALTSRKRRVLQDFFMTTTDNNTNMPYSAVAISVIWAISIILRFCVATRTRKRRRLQRMRMLMDTFATGDPRSYCRLNSNMPILRLWFNVEEMVIWLCIFCC